MDSKPTLGQILRAAREARGLTQKATMELAFGSGGRHGQLSYWESDRIEPSATNFLTLAFALNLSLNDFTPVINAKEQPK